MFKKYRILLIITIFPLMVSGQTVGLVLSGGGAKGLAHIGVIKALEEHRIPIDYMGGTSIGAIVGGLYALGMTTDEMIRIIKSEDFSHWISGTVEEEYKYYFKTEYPGPDLISVGLDVKDTVPKTRLPLSVIPNHLMDFAFMEMFSRASAAAGYNFDSLFVPFLCNAVDVSNSKEVVFREGDLAQAVRASMTVPLYFWPVLMDGNIMYDGGIYNNFPADHVKDHFQPDVIIGSKAAKGNIPPDEFDIQKQIENIVMKPSDYSIDPRNGILLDLDIDRQPLLAFDKLDELVETGYQKTLQKIDSIQLLVQRKACDSVSLSHKRETFRAAWPEFTFKDIELEGLNLAQEHYVKQSIWRKDTLMDINTLKREYMKLANDQSLFYLYPRALYHPGDSLFTLNLRVVPKSPLEARFGLFFATTGLAQTYLGFSYRAISEVSSHLKGSVQFGRLYNGVNLGFRFDYPSRIPLYFQGSFNYNGFNYNHYHTKFFFEDLKPSYTTEDEINFRFDVGMPYSTNGMIKGGLGIGRNREVYYMTQNVSSLDTSDISRVDLLSVYLTGEKNTLNNRQFATEGTYRKLALRFGYGIENYYPGSTSPAAVDAKMDYFWFSAGYENVGYIQIKGSLGLGYHYVMQATFKPMLNNYFSTIIEAPVFQPNLITKSFFMEKYRAHQYIAAGIMPVYTFSNQVHTKLEAYAFFPVLEILKDENNKAYYGNFFSSMNTLFAASLNIVTVAGPVSLHAGYFSGEESPWVLQLSFGYLLFNKRSTDE